MKDTNFTLAEIKPRNTEEIELQVLKDLTEHDDLVAEVINVIRPDYFTSEGRRNFWNGIVSYFNKGETLPGVHALMDVDQETHDAFIAFQNSNTFCYTLDQALSHIAILRNEAAKRRAYYCGLTILQLATGNCSESEVFARASEAVQGLEDKAVKEEYSLREIFNEISEEVQERKALYDSGRKANIASGFQNLDDATSGGFKSGNLIVIAARPSIGKTALALQLIRNTASNGNRVVFFSIEMMRSEIGNRLLYSTERVDSHQVWTGNMDWNAFEEAVKEMGDLPILVNDHSRDLAEIVTRMTILNRRGLCDIAYVDYLGLINTADKKIPLYQQIAEITGTLKVTAKRLRIPIVLLCQLNRDAAGADCDPDLNHLRDSGSIEQDADLVLMLRREKEREDVLQILVRKNRHGRANLRIRLATNRTRTNYHEIELLEICE